VTNIGKKYNLIQRAIIEHKKIYDERHYSAQQMYA
jgi:hypothetical protein